MTGQIPDAEIIRRVREALSITDKLTMTMLQAHLTSRVPKAARERALRCLQEAGEIVVRHTHVQSWQGRMVAVPLIVRAK